MGIVCEGIINERITALELAALTRYNERYNKWSFEMATEGKSVAYANRLIDAALAICGHPAQVHKYNTHWNDRAQEFLAQFAEERA